MIETSSTKINSRLYVSSSKNIAKTKRGKKFHRKRFAVAMTTIRTKIVQRFFVALTNSKTETLRAFFSLLLLQNILLSVSLCNFNEKEKSLQFPIILHVHFIEIIIFIF